MALYLITFLFDATGRREQFEKLIRDIAGTYCYPLQFGSTWIVESKLLAHQFGEKIKANFTKDTDVFFIAQINPENTAFCGRSISEGLKQVLPAVSLCPDRVELESQDSL